MVERAYARLSRVLRHEFRERKPLIVYASHGDFQQTNVLPMFIDESTGGVTEAYRSRMILPFTGSYAHFDHVLTHELVHAFQFDVIFRRGVMVDAVPLGPRLPLWFLEGMAEYLSVGRVDALTAAWLRDAVLSGYLRSMDELNRRDDYLSYRFGQALWAWIAGRWGDEVVGILLQKAPRVGLERAFAGTLGMTLDALGEAWTRAVRLEHLPEVAALEPPDGFARPLLGRERLEDPWALAPALSPDGRRIAYLSQRTGFAFDLWLADAATGRVERRVVEAARSADFESLRYMNSGAAFSPDGRYLAFAAQSAGRDALYVYDVERRRIARRLRIELSAVTAPTWSPDGRRIAFSGLDGGVSDLYVTDLDGNVERLTDDRFADLLPAWSPDGRTLAFTTDRGPGTDFERLAYGNFRTALYDLATGDITLLPGQDEGKNVSPVWAPDGGSLIWVGDRTGTNDLYRYDLGTGRLERITTLVSGAIGIAPLSPVLSRAANGALAFVHFERAGYDILLVDDPDALPRRPVPTVRPVAGARAAGSADAADGAGVPVGAVTDRLSTGPAGPAGGRGFAGSYYRGGEGLRPSGRAAPPADPGAAPISVMALLDSAALALPDPQRFQFRDYRPRLTPDVVGRPSIGARVGGHYGNGLYGGSFIALSDMLGGHNVLAALALNGALADASVHAGYAFLGARPKLSVALSQTPFYRYFGTAVLPVGDDASRDAVANVFVRDVLRGGQAQVSYPFSRFRRIEVGALAAHYATDVLYRGYVRSTGGPYVRDEALESLGFVQPTAAIVFDNAVFGWTGPILGRRYRLQVARTAGGLSYSEVLADARNYWNWRQQVVLAVRAFGLVRRGEDADRFALYWGGPYFLRGWDGGSFDLEGGECRASRDAAGGASLSRCPVRDQLIGSSAALVNAELRVPVIRELQVGGLGSFPPIDAVAFVDGGLAWDHGVCQLADPTRTRRCEATEPVRVVLRRAPDRDPYVYRAPLFSAGVGLRVNVFYTVLRLDYAVPFDRPGRRGVFSVGLGPSF
jgi:hypothetical protein